MAEFKKQGAVYFDDKETVDKLRETVFPGGVMNKDLVGQPIAKVAEAAGIEIPEGTKLIMVYPGAYGSADSFSKEKMCPVMSVYKWKTFDEAIEIAKENLIFNGAGHSCSIQSNNKDHIEKAGEVLPVSRVLVNQSCASMNGGAFVNGLKCHHDVGLRKLGEQLHFREPHLSSTSLTSRGSLMLSRTPRRLPMRKSGAE